MELKIEIDLSKLTLGDLEKWESGGEAAPISTLIEVLAKCTNLTREEIRQIPLSEMGQVRAELEKAFSELREAATPFGTSSGS